jgi:hypothetical protein
MAITLEITPEKEEGVTEQAVTVLRDAGHNAWRNEVGHVAIAYDGS